MMQASNFDNEFLIKFGGENHIRVETLTEFLDNYRKLLYKINTVLGYSEEDLIVEVSPPENGSFKIRINPKYENQMLNTLSGIIAGTFSGLLLVWFLGINNNISIEDVSRIISSIPTKNKQEIATQVYNTYQQVDVKQLINQTFITVAKDANITSLGVEQNKTEIINIPKKDFQKFILPENELVETCIEPEKIEIDEISIIIRTVHFEGNAKWGFIWKGYPIRAYLRDERFLERLSSEAFKRGDILKVKLQKMSNFSKELNTYIVDEKSYEILEVLQHTSKSDEMDSIGLFD